MLMKSSTHSMNTGWPVLLNNGEEEIECELASPADALRVEVMMLARRGCLVSGDVLKVIA